MNRTRKGLIATLMLVAVTSLTWAAGNWSTLPIVGGSSFCASTVTGTGSLGGITGQGQGSTGSICAQTVPAGPPSLTGAEQFPADTKLTGSAPPQTVVVTTCQLGAGAYSLVSATAGADTIANQICYYIIDGLGAVAALTITMPSAPLDGQLLRISSRITVSSLTMSAAAGQTLLGGATSATANTSTGGWIYRATNTSWYRIQ